MSVVSLLAAVVIHGGVVAGGWAIAGTTGVIAALTIVVAVEHRLARNRALTAHNTDRSTALLVDSFTASQHRHHPSISLLVPLRGATPRAGTTRSAVHGCRAPPRRGVRHRRRHAA